MVAPIGKNEAISVEDVSGGQIRTMRRQMLGEILEPRMEEILSLLQSELEQHGLIRDIPCGLVLTGGSSQLAYLPELARQVFNFPARIGYPMAVGGLTDVVNNPMYSTAVGLVLYGARNKTERKFRIRDVNIFNRVTSRMRKWFRD